MPEDIHTIPFSKALEELDPIKLAKANVSRRRYELRQLRLQRQQLALQKKRSQQALDPMARALAKAKALANQQDT
jgi:hypothetical protein